MAAEEEKKSRAKATQNFIFFAGAAVASCQSLNMMMGVVEVEEGGGERKSEELCDA